MFPGLIAVAIFFQGIMAVGLPLAVELSTGREIDDRLVAPVPLGLLAAEKIIFSTFQSIVAALVTFPFLYFIPALPIHLNVPSWTFLVSFVLLSGLASGAVGLMLGTLVKPQNISAIFSIIITPMTFLGCVYYPWVMLFRVPLLQKSVLLNPLVYVSEGILIQPDRKIFRGAVFLGKNCKGRIYVQISLINMPFASLEMPSLALTQLKSVLEEQLARRYRFESSI
jgi:ABC-2 type transport system permease protein